MNKILAYVLLSTLAVTASAAEPTKNDAVAMVERGVTFTKSNGSAEMIKLVNAKDPQFAQGSLYIYVRDAKSGINLAHPYNAALVGKDTNDVPDTNGKFYRREILEIGKKTDGKGWVDYMYKNPENGKVESKTAYVQRAGDIVLVAGVYKD